MPKPVNLGDYAQFPRVSAPRQTDVKQGGKRKKRHFSYVKARQARLRQDAERINRQVDEWAKGVENKKAERDFLRDGGRMLGGRPSPIRPGGAKRSPLKLELPFMGRILKADGGGIFSEKADNSALTYTDFDWMCLQGSIFFQIRLTFFFQFVCVVRRWWG